MNQATPFKHCGLFHTPETMEELNTTIQTYSGGEGIAAAIVHGLTWNFLVTQFELWYAQQSEPEPETWHTSHWDEHPEFSVADWKYEVDNNDTRQGYHDWVQAQLDAR